jgi:hypothetical protein
MNAARASQKASSKKSWPGGRCALGVVKLDARRVLRADAAQVEQKRWRETPLPA